MSPSPVDSQLYATDRVASYHVDRQEMRLGPPAGILALIGRLAGALAGGAASIERWARRPGASRVPEAPTSTNTSAAA